MAPEPSAPRPLPHTRPAASLQFLCPRCEEMFLLGPETLERPADRLCCPHCELALEGFPAGFSTEVPLERCLVCGNDEFYLQKDFNRELGLMIVIGSALLVFLVMLILDHRLGILCLLAIAALDWFVYRRLASVTVCYLCQSVYRGFPPGKEHAGFYLGNEEKYKKLRQAWVKHLGA